MYEDRFHVILKAFPGPDRKTNFDSPIVQDPEGHEYHLCFSTMEKYNDFLAQAVIQEDQILARYNHNIEELITHKLDVSLIVDIFPVYGLLVDVDYDDMNRIRNGEPVEHPEREPESLVGEAGPVHIRRFDDREADQGSRSGAEF